MESKRSRGDGGKKRECMLGQILLVGHRAMATSATFARATARIETFIITVSETAKSGIVGGGGSLQSVV